MTYEVAPVANGGAETPPPDITVEQWAGLLVEEGLATSYDEALVCAQLGMDWFTEMSLLFPDIEPPVTKEQIQKIIDSCLLTAADKLPRSAKFASGVIKFTVIVPAKEVMINHFPDQVDRDFLRALY